MFSLISLERERKKLKRSEEGRGGEDERGGREENV